MNSVLTTKRRWLAIALLIMTLVIVFGPATRLVADTNPVDPPIGIPAEPGTTPPDTTVVPDPLNGPDSITTWDILYAIIVAL